MSKKLSWVKRIRKFANKIKDTDEKWAADVEKFTKGAIETSDEFLESISTGLNKLNNKQMKIQIESIVKTEVHMHEFEIMHPNLDHQAIRDRLNYNSNANVISKNPDVEHMEGCWELIEKLKSKYPELDWEKLEEKIIERLRY